MRFLITGVGMAIMAAGVLSMMYGDLTKNAHVAKIGVSMMIGGMCVSTVGLAL